MLCRELAPKLKDVGQRVLLLVGDGDWLIPSADEGARLQKLLQRCQLRVLITCNPLDPLILYIVMHCIWTHVCCHLHVWRCHGISYSFVSLLTDG